MDTRLLTLFADTARLGSFAEAARLHDLDPSRVSRSIAQLEERLGLRLFQRTTRRLRLTEAGGLYLARITPLLEEIDRAADEARAVTAGPRGTLRLTASVAFAQTCIVPLLPGLRAAYPDLAIELIASDARLDLVESRIDLAIRLGAVLEGDWIATKLMPTRYRVVATPGTPRPVAPGALAQIPCLLFTLPEFRNTWRFRDASGTETEVPVTGHITISNALALAEAARAGLGPALLADWLIAGDLAAGRLIDLFPDHEVTATSFDTAAWALYPSRAYVPAKTRAVLGHLRGYLP